MRSRGRADLLIVVFQLAPCGQPGLSILSDCHDAVVCYDLVWLSDLLLHGLHVPLPVPVSFAGPSAKAKQDQTDYSPSEAEPSYFSADPTPCILDNPFHHSGLEGIAKAVNRNL